MTLCGGGMDIFWNHTLTSVKKFKADILSINDQALLVWPGSGIAKYRLYRHCRIRTWATLILGRGRGYSINKEALPRGSNQYPQIY